MAWTAISSTVDAGGPCKQIVSFTGTSVADPGCFIPDPDPTIAPSRIQIPGGKKAPDPGSGIKASRIRGVRKHRIPDPQHWPVRYVLYYDPNAWILESLRNSIIHKTWIKYLSNFQLFSPFSIIQASTRKLSNLLKKLKIICNINILQYIRGFKLRSITYYPRRKFFFLLITRKKL
jgi:hypothetical protein